MGPSRNPMANHPHPFAPRLLATKPARIPQVIQNSTNTKSGSTFFLFRIPGGTPPRHQIH